MHERVEEKRREQMLRLRKAMIGRKPAWRALRSAARFVYIRERSHQSGSAAPLHECMLMNKARTRAGPGLSRVTAAGRGPRAGRAPSASDGNDGGPRHSDTYAVREILPGNARAASTFSSSHSFAMLFFASLLLFCFARSRTQSSHRCTKPSFRLFILMRHIFQASSTLRWTPTDLAFVFD